MGTKHKTLPVESNRSFRFIPAEFTPLCPGYQLRCLSSCQLSFEDDEINTIFALDENTCDSLSIFQCLKHATRDFALSKMESQDSFLNTTNWPDFAENNSESANSSSPKYVHPEELMDAAAVCYVIFTIVGVSGNLISILAMATSPQLRNATTAFIINLGVVDFIFCSFSCPLQAVTYASRYRVYGEGALCTLFAFISYANVLVSIFTVVAITINRYICIVHSKWYSRIYRPWHVAIMIATIWLTAFSVLSLPLFEVWGTFGPVKQGLSCDMQNLNGKSPKQVVFVTFLLLPTVSFIVCYSRIYCVVRKASSKVQSFDVSRSSHAARSAATPQRTQPMNARQAARKFLSWFRRKDRGQVIEAPHDKKRRKDLKVLQVTLVIFISYVVCYFPVSIIKLIRKQEAGHVIIVLGYLMVFLANCINPLIYVALSDEYRKAYFRLFACRKGDSPPTSTDTAESAVSWKVSLEQPEIIH